MSKRYLWCVLAVMSLAGCSLMGPSRADRQDSGRLDGADQAVAMGQYRGAEQLLSQYVYRDEGGRLKLKYFGINGDNRKRAINTVVSLLWETGRDETLQQFADDYLSGKEYRTIVCRLSERQGLFEQAYQCWNRIGEIDRAERVIRSEAALRILQQP
ncbi:hypothetical protein [Pseudomonas guariconensis]|uniref:hypothetical protein n=1 Tax=Pseudomonas guariconensis TaxID=1288410 RepID=UPI0039061479